MKNKLGNILDSAEQLGDGMQSVLVSALKLRYGSPPESAVLKEQHVPCC